MLDANSLGFDTNENMADTLWGPGIAIGRAITGVDRALIVLF